MVHVVCHGSLWCDPTDECPFSPAEQLAVGSPVLARAHLFYAGFYGEVERMLVSEEGMGRGLASGGQRTVLQVTLCLDGPELAHVRPWI